MKNSRVCDGCFQIIKYDQQFRKADFANTVSVLRPQSLIEGKPIIQRTKIKSPVMPLPNLFEFELFCFVLLNQ